VDERVADLVRRHFLDEFGNAGSRTHAYGTEARAAGERARVQVAAVADAEPDEVIFTSGATESDNLAILGLAAYGAETDRRHIITSAMEHKAVLEPCEVLERRGFEVTYLPADSTGRVDPAQVGLALRPDTLLVSIMHVNNETGIIQPLAAIASLLDDHPAFFHVDAAQGFGKDLDGLRTRRVDMISVSGHKLYAPKGVGALVARRRGGRDLPPLAPLMFGGGQERGLRPGTLPVALVAGLGLAAELAVSEHDARMSAGRRIERQLSDFVASAGGLINGCRDWAIPFILNASFPGIDSEAFIVATKGAISVSNGAACSSSSYDRSHVLRAMHLPEARLASAIRMSWSWDTELPDLDCVSRLVDGLRL
jgi:cysteine desulfurase